MSLLVYVCYPLLAVFLFWGVKIYKKNEWNTEFLSLSQTKALQGFCAVAIMFHHISQKTCAPWLNPKVIVHGLDFFVSIGYWFVGIFLFCSGYGLYKSFKEKPDYLQGFFNRRILPLIVVFCTTSICYQIARLRMDYGVHLFSSPLQVGGPDLANPYAWYMLMLPILYLGFYFAFRYCKKDWIAVTITSVVVLTYIIHCDMWMYGGWWYNSAPLFVVGIFIAKYEKVIVEKWKSHYIISLIMSTCSAVLLHLLSENTQPIFAFLHWNFEHELFRWVRILLQMGSCIFFTVAVFIAGMKIRIGNKALTFMGTITLEFYLIHGLFVQLFGYCFMSDMVVSIYYIRNVALFTVIVLALAIIAAFLLHKLNQLITQLLLSQKKLIAVMTRDARKFIIIALALFCLVTVVMSITAHNKSRQVKEKVNAYSRDNISYVDIDGQKMAAYVAGEGEHTIVMLRGADNPCPTLTLKPIADDLAENNHVIILDYFGSGFSDDTDRERSIENFVYEIHTALKGLGEEGPYILMPIEVSSVYAQLYTEMYPQEVEAVVGINGSVTEQMQELIKAERINTGDFIRRERKIAKLQNACQRLIATCGYTGVQWALYESVFYHTHTSTELTTMRELMFTKLYSQNTVEEMTNFYDNMIRLSDYQYPQEMPVLMILDYDSCNAQWTKSKNSYLINPKLDWQKLHENQFSNTDIQRIQVMSGNSYLIYYNPHAVSACVQEFLDEMFP